VHIVIVGGGLVGSTLAARLSRDGHDVVLIEGDARRARELSESLDAQVIAGNGATAPILRQAGITQADLVVATTNRDESNLVVGMLASTLFNVPRLVVRLRNPNHEEGFATMAREHPGEHVCVYPGAAAVDRIWALLEVPGALDVVSFMEGELLVAGFRINEDSDFAGFPVSHMSLLFADAATLVVAIQRKHQWVIPHGGEQMMVGDIAYFAIARKDLDNVLTLVGAPREPKHRIMIAGASPIGLRLARRLEESDLQVVLVEENAELAREAAESLGDTLVVQGQATDETILDEEDIKRVSTFVALTADHEANLVAGLLAKQLGAKRAFALVDNPALAHLIGEIGIDAVISPRLLAVSLTLQHIRGTRVHSVATLLEDEIEVVEAEATEDGLLSKRPLAELDLPRGVLVAALRRGEKILVPRGGDRVEPGDDVLFITTTENAPRLAKFLSG
jgi:trk system potassium uptake protein TrkA